MQKMIAMMVAVFSIMISVINTDVKVPYDVYSDVSYGSLSDNKMDIYIPQNAYKAKEIGCVIYLHGGSWYGGDKKSMKNDCIKTAQSGYVSATMNYSLLSQSDYSIDKVLEEVSKAMKKVQSYAKTKKVNITKVALGGHSAGAHIALLYSYKMASKSPIKLCFVTSKSGPVDFHEENWSEGVSIMAMLLSGDALKYDFNNMTEAEENKVIEKMIKKVSPLNYVSKTSIPTIIAHGKKDTTVVYKQATLLRDKLKKYGVDYTLITFADSGHKLDNNPKTLDKYYETVKKYCRTYF